MSAELSHKHPLHDLSVLSGVMHAPGHCPKCGDLNECAQDCKKPAASCWCVSHPLPRGTLDELCVSSRERGCLCQNCLCSLNEAK